MTARPQLLVVDDSPTIRKLVEISFRTTGWSVDYAACGKEAMTLADNRPPDLILLDYVLPDMKGVDVCSMLARSERTSHAPIILMTAKDPTVRADFKGFDSVVGFMAKPFTSADLMARALPIIEAKAEAKGAPLLTREKKEAAAKLIFNRLRSRLALIPEWVPSLGANPPAMFFARKILTPDLMEELIEELLPFYRELLSKGK